MLQGRKSESYNVTMRGKKLRLQCFAGTVRFSGAAAGSSEPAEQASALFCAIFRLVIRALKLDPH